MSLQQNGNDRGKGKHDRCTEVIQVETHQQYRLKFL